VNKIERVQAALRGEAVDRVPVSFWGHTFDREDSASALAQSTLAFNHTYDWDFIKVQARASYHGEI
jgi:uroporphyrinogen decarboxylase